MDNASEIDPRESRAAFADQDQPFFRGVNHVALVTNDMDATIRFYCGVLGCRLVAHLGNRAFRHYFFEIGPGSTIAFFEYSGVSFERFSTFAGLPDPRKPQFDHLSLTVADEAALERLQRRLKAAGCAVTDVVDHVFVRSIYFDDPNGIALEASWWVTDATGRPVDFTDPVLFSDPRPPAAARELAEHGRVLETPRTTLPG
jgi:catechol 2,3-dioxygenase-like lactoylglutathione lyase family enzyme